MADFYNTLHDGFTYYPAESMGFRKAQDLCSVADLIDEEDTEFAKNWLALFSNGGGDYVALDLGFSSENRGVIWWHDQPLEPELNVNIFKIIDTWISIFLEDTRLRESVLVRRVGLDFE
jgi:hypothetical protein